MTRWIICAIGLAWAVAGCGGTGADGTTTAALGSVQQAASTCKNYDGYTAALAEATIDCLGAIGPNDYTTDAAGATGFLFPTFDSCPAEVIEPPPPEHPNARRVPAMLRIRRLLSLQDAKAHQFTQLGIPCIRDAYLIAAKRLVGSGVTVCPNWHKVFTGGAPTAKNVVAMKGRIPKPQLRVVKGEDKPAWVIDPPRPGSGFRFPKEYFFYTVSFDDQKVPPPGQTCGSAVACARACSGLFEGFLVGRFGKYLVGDPYWWLDPTDYGGFDSSNDPYNRITGFYHPMSLAGDDVPGEIYGDYARAAIDDATPDPFGTAELCTRWDGTDHRMARLVKDNLLGPSETWLSRCELYPASEAPVF
jgi:hypothetical protein